MNSVTIISIDRAEKQLGFACKKFAEIHNLQIETILIVNDSFAKTPAYKGDETNGLFKEIRCDFSDTIALLEILNKYINKKVILHCRMEEAIKDYQKVISLMPNAVVQSVESLELSTQKFNMRKAIASKYPNICPKFIQISRIDELNETILQQFNYPVIIKPNGLHSSFFVTKCSSYDEVYTNAVEIFSEIEKVYAREYGTGDPSLVIEEFMQGEMYSIDAYITKDKEYFFLPIIRVVTAAELGLDGYYSYRHILPTSISPQEIIDANECARQGIEALGLFNSTAHIELYKTNSGWKIIEIGPRIGGYRQELYMEAFGIDHYYNDLLVHYGEKPDLTRRWEKHAAGLNIYAKREGVITNIQGIEEACKLESIVSLKCYVKEGDKAVFASKGGQFLVDGILSNESKDALEKDVATVRSLINFTVE